MNSPQQTAEGLAEKIADKITYSTRHILKHSERQNFLLQSDRDLCRNLAIDIIKPTLASFLADKEKVAKLEAELQYERNVNYYNDYAKAKVENAELLKEKEMLSYVIKHHESFRNLFGTMVPIRQNICR